MSRKLAIFLSILVGGVALDQITKLLVVQGLTLGDQVPVIEGFFNLVLVYNRGAAFGLFSNLSVEFAWVFFIITTSLVLAVVTFLWWRLPEDKTLAAVGYSLIFAGAVGNLIDRVRLGEVIDFLDFHLGPGIARTLGRREQLEGAPVVFHRVVPGHLAGVLEAEYARQIQVR